MSLNLKGVEIENIFNQMDSLDMNRELDLKKLYIRDFEVRTLGEYTLICNHIKKESIYILLNQKHQYICGSCSCAKQEICNHILKTLVTIKNLGFISTYQTNRNEFNEN